MASVDAQQYAEALRRSLMEDLFNGEELGEEQEADGAAGLLQDTADAAAGSQFQDLDKELEEFANHDIIRKILEQGCVLKEYTRDVDQKLCSLELESIQDYIQESDNLVALHDQVCAAAESPP